MARIRAAYGLPPGENRATPIGLAAPVRPGKGRRNKRAREKEALPDHPYESSKAGSLERAQKARDKGGCRTLQSVLPVTELLMTTSIHQCRRQAPENINLVSSNSPSPGLPPPLRASGEGTSRVDPGAHLLEVKEASSWRCSYDNEVPILDNPKRLALIWHKIRERRCELPSFGDMRERDAYDRMAVANAKAMEASNEYATLMEKQLADFLSKEEVGSHLLTIHQLQGELEAVRVTEQQRDVEIEGSKGKLAAAEMEKVALLNDLDSMKEKHTREIEGRDAAARKERDLACRSLAREYDENMKDKLHEGGFELEEELERLRDREFSLDVDYGLASVSDSSLSRLELPEVSGDSVDQD
ncbi:hypothetical protein F2Q70_00036475 [Brassica cretica]|uniref:Uncharacterized protein n=1 Tax=Brassica cretica TaxID=69181 RepID=A0A8S9JR86_BRACR|nr:hypothetical protein F2Q70_00036475 [Brassica cretica]